MAKTVPVEVRMADLPQIKQFIGSVAALLKTLAECQNLLPDPVMAAADQLRRDVAALGGRDIGPPPEPSDEDRIRDAMAEAQAHPGRTITR
jgi:hypothetical protein